jgi:hypothetical protein
MVSKEFKELMSDMLDKGWRTYYIRDMKEFEERIPYLTNFCGVEIVIYDKHPYAFIRDTYKKEDE